MAELARQTRNQSIWGTEPLLHRIPKGQYRGRVFVEVWDNTSHVVVCGGDSSLVAAAATALRGQYISLRDGELPWTNEPESIEATKVRTTSAFLGRVVIELWNNGAVVGINGSDPRVLERAKQHLNKPLPQILR